MRYVFKRDDLYALAMSIHAETKEKGKELFFKYCPYCMGGDGRDKETFSVNLEGGMYHCFRAGCGKSGHFVELARDFGYKLDFEDDPFKKKYRKLKQKPIEVRDKAVEYLATRGISKETAKKYHITTMRGRDNILVFPFFDENGVMVAVKYRKTDFDKERDKNKEWFEKDTKPILFGMLQCADKTKPLIITEGQLDSMSVSECGIENAVSVPNGCTAKTWIPLCHDWVKQFPEIIVFGDSDAAGQTMVDNIIQSFPDMKIRNVRKIDYLGEKDANDILRTFGKDAVIKCIENAEQMEVTAVKELAQVKDVDLSAMPKLLTGVSAIDKIIGGMYLGQLVVLTGKRGEGKSTFASNIIANVLNQNAGVFVYSGELPDFHFKHWLNLQIAGKDKINARENDFGGHEYYLKPEISEIISDWYAGRAYIYDNTAIYSDDEIPELTQTIEQSVRRYNLQFVLIDNLMTAFTNDSSNYYLSQGKFMKELKRLALRLNIVILLVAHPRKEGGNDLDNDSVSGSSVVTDIADTVLTYSRNTTEDESFHSLIGITKNRLYGKLLVGKYRAKVRYSEVSKRVICDGDDLNKVYGCFAKPQAYEAPPF